MPESPAQYSPVDGPEDRTTCAWMTDSWLFGASICGEPATRLVTSGCLHEHMYACPSCDRCADKASAEFFGSVSCTPCRDRAGEDGVKVALISNVPIGDPDA